jgi:hypothetical protein
MIPNNPGRIKLELLSKGLTFSKGSNKNIGTKHTEKRYMFGYSDRVTGLNELIPPEILIGETVIAVHQRIDSPWKVIIGKQADEFILCHNNQEICKVNYPKRPSFYGIQLSSGVMSEEVATMYGVHVLAFFVRGHCQFYDNGKQCHFCSLNPTRKITKDAIKKIVPTIASEVSQLALEAYGEEIRYIMYCGGSYWDHDTEVKEYLDIIREINSQVTIPTRIRQHVLSMPPHNLSLLDEMKEAGINDYAFAIEVWDPELFKMICPGKNETYGRKNYLKAFEYAVNVFGEGNVYCVLVGGLEPLESLLNGFRELQGMGVVPSVNVFHPDPKSILHDRAAPDSEYLLEMAKIQGRIYRESNFKPSIFGYARSSLDTEAFLGYFEENSQQNF